VYYFKTLRRAMRRSVFFGKNGLIVMRGKKGSLAPLCRVDSKTNGHSVGLKKREVQNLSQFSLVTVTPGSYLGIRQSRFFRFTRFS
jgi:hypothetical protein